MNCSSHYIASGYFKVIFFQTALSWLQSVVIVNVLIEHTQALNPKTFLTSSGVKIKWLSMLFTEIYEEMILLIIS